MAALAMGAVVSGCASRPLTKDPELSGTEQTGVALAVGLCAVLLVVHLVRWMLGRQPRGGDTTAVQLAVSAVLALAGATLVVLTHLRADDLLDRPVGEEPTTVISLEAECGVTSGDDFLEFHADYDTCSVDHSMAPVAIALALTGAGLLYLGRQERSATGGTGVVLIGTLSPLPIGVAAAIGLYEITPGTSGLFLGAGAVATGVALWVRLSLAVDRHRDRTPQPDPP